MGVDLGLIVAKEEIDVAHLSGRKLAVDAYNALYQFLSIIRQRDGTPLLDAKGRITSHLSGLFYRTANLLEYGIKPVYVFDGVPPEEKKRTIEERIAIREEAKEKWVEALAMGDAEAVRRYSQASSHLTSDMVEEAKKLLSLMGLPVVNAPSEGEAQAAHMAKKGDVWACSSQDYDSLLFGAPLLVRNLTITGRRKLPRKDVYVQIVPELIYLDKTLEQNGLTHEKLIWLGVLIGTDFNEGVRGVGPKKALKLVSSHGSFDEIASELVLDETFSQALRIFKNPNVSDDYSVYFKEPDSEGIISFLCDEHDFSRERVEKVLDKIGQRVGTQSKLDEWF
ncbi:MAG: flap endonuclease-1 [Candidatus Micrarchaeia archaeon]